MRELSFFFIMFVCCFGSPSFLCLGGFCDHGTATKTDVTVT